MNAVTLFQYAGHDVRTITIDGERDCRMIR